MGNIDRARIGSVLGNEFHVESLSQSHPGRRVPHIGEFQTIAHIQGYEFLAGGIGAYEFIRQDNTLYDARIGSSSERLFRCCAFPREVLLDSLIPRLDRLARSEARFAFEPIVGYFIDPVLGDDSYFVHEYNRAPDFFSLSKRSELSTRRQLSESLSAGLADFHNLGFAYMDPSPINFRFDRSDRIIPNHHYSILHGEVGRLDQYNDLRLLIATNEWLPDIEVFLDGYEAECHPPDRQFASRWRRDSNRRRSKHSVEVDEPQVLAPAWRLRLMK